MLKGHWNTAFSASLMSTCGLCHSVTVASRPSSCSCSDPEDVEGVEVELLHQKAVHVWSHFLLHSGPLPIQAVRHSVTSDNSISPTAIWESDGRWLEVGKKEQVIERFVGC